MLDETGPSSDFCFGPQGSSCRLSSSCYFFVVFLMSCTFWIRKLWRSCDHWRVNSLLRWCFLRTQTSHHLNSIYFVVLLAPPPTDPSKGSLYATYITNQWSLLSTDPRNLRNRTKCSNTTGNHRTGVSRFSPKFKPELKKHPCNESLSLRTRTSTSTSSSLKLFQRVLAPINQSATL